MASNATTAVIKTTTLQQTLIGLNDSPKQEPHAPHGVVHYHQEQLLAELNELSRADAFGTSAKRPGITEMKNDVIARVAAGAGTAAKQIFSSIMFVGAFVVALAVVALLPPIHGLFHLSPQTETAILVGLGILAAAEIAFGIVGYRRASKNA